MVLDVARRCRERNLEHLLSAFEESAESGLAGFLTAFYFRYRTERVEGERTFEFTHKSFSEYLTARWIISTAEHLADKSAASDVAPAWLAAFGDIHFDPYLTRFFVQELEALDAERRSRTRRVAADMLRQAVRPGLPVHLLSQRRDLHDELAMVANASIVALAFVSAAAAADGTRERFRFDDAYAFAEWLRLAAGHRGRDTAPQVLRFLSYLDIGKCDLKHLDLGGADLSHSKFLDAQLTNAILRKANLDACELPNATFDGTLVREATMRDADLTGSSIQDATFSDVNLIRATLDNVTCLDTSFRGADLSDSKMRSAIFSDCDFTDATLTRADLTGTNIRGTVIGAELSLATFTDADISEATFSRCRLDGAVFRDTKARTSTFVNNELTSQQLAGLILQDSREQQ